MIHKIIPIHQIIPQHIKKNKPKPPPIRTMGYQPKCKPKRQPKKQDRFTVDDRFIDEKKTLFSIMKGILLFILLILITYEILF